MDILRKEFHLVCGVNILGVQSHHYLSVYEIGWQGRTIVAYSSNWLSVSCAILAGITFPPIPWPMSDIDSDNLDSYTKKHDDWNLAFAHHKEEEEVYPLTLTEIADAQHKDQELKAYLKKNAILPQKDIGLHLIEDIKVLCKNGKVMIPTSLWHRAVSWYHHYLQHPGHSRLKETMRSMMYWKGMHTTIQKYVKSCRSCQVNKSHSQKYGNLPPKLVITTPWKALCVDLIGSYTLRGKDGSSIDFMCLTMINPQQAGSK